MNAARNFAVTPGCAGLRLARCSTEPPRIACATAWIPGIPTRASRSEQRHRARKLLAWNLPLRGEQAETKGYRANCRKRLDTLAPVRAATAGEAAGPAAEQFSSN